MRTKVNLPISRNSIAIVTGFRANSNFVSTDRLADSESSKCDIALPTFLKCASGCASVTRNNIAVIALFDRQSVAITTDWLADRVTKGVPLAGPAFLHSAHRRATKDIIRN